MAGGLSKGVSTAGIDDGKVGVEPMRMRILELRMLEQAAPKRAFSQQRIIWLSCESSR